MSCYTKRILSDIKEIETDKENGINILILDNNIKTLRGSIIGPEDTCYKGGLFYLNIKINDNYPFTPPEVKFETKIWHPNISSSSGCICLDILKTKWRAVFSLKTVLLSIKILLCEPNPSDPQDAVVARQILENKDLFTRTAKLWIYEFANDKKNSDFSDPEFEEKIEFFEKKGFERKKIISVLSCNNWFVGGITYDLFEN